MPKFSIQELIYILQIISKLVGAIFSVLVVNLGVAVFIYKSDRKRNEKEHTTLFQKSDDQGERISKIEGKLDL